MKNYFATEETRKHLLRFINETEQVMQETLQTIDPQASCAILPSLDLCFPHDLIRIVGGFPTGCFVSWNCRVPFVPVDTTVNVCTSSVYLLSADVTDKLDEEYFRSVFSKVENSSYMLNFHRGNHFASFTQSNNTGQSYLVLHSSASEFKKTYNGLFPAPGNWYMDELKVYRTGQRHIRYIVGKKAELFVGIAQQIENFNVIRHDFFASELISNLCRIEQSTHFHHYQMPTSQSVLIGCFLVDPGERIPIFTYPGDPIFIFKVSNANLTARVNGVSKLLMPHGWGKTSSVPPRSAIDLDANTYQLNDHVFQIDSSASLRAHPDLTLRRFSTNESDDNYYFKHTSSYFNGDVIDKLTQKVSYNKLGYRRWA